MNMPVLPIRDRVVFPNVQITLVVGRERSIRALQKALAGDHLIFIAAQRQMKVEEPTREDLYAHGTVAEVIQSMVMPDGLVRVRIYGRSRAKLMDASVGDTCLMGDIQTVETLSMEKEPPLEMEALRRMLLRQFEDYARKTGRVTEEWVSNVNKMTSLDQMCDTISDMLAISIEEKQDLIETLHIPTRMSRLVEILNAEIEILNLERKIQTRVNRQVEKNQKEYFLNEQMRAIQKELKKKDDHAQEAEELKTKIKELKMPPEAEEVALKEVGRLEKMMPYSPESTVVRTYLDWMTALPWNKRTGDSLDVPLARAVLEADHFGLDKPKERILEYLAVLKLTKSIQGPVLCFVGPAGTGKTSLAKSMARAMGREFVRISLGGVRDESEIRGHRRTYIGALPGRLIQALKRTKTKNPVILLDEIDKMGSDWRGDPAAALLEVLDPEQNKSFVDHYLDVGFDLSEVIFIATANSLYSIPQTLTDRLEVIRFSAYTTDEKVAIANKYLLPKQLKEHGLAPMSVRFSDEALRKMIHIYTQEAGVRGLQRKIAQACRKVAVEWVEKKSNAKQKVLPVGLNDLSHYLGVPEFDRPKMHVNSVGIATGLAWTEHGGEILTVEVTTLPGEGKVILTGKLGDVMRESAQAALTLVKSMAKKFHLSESVFKKRDVHVHVPEGAVPKDGPSAGVALATAMMSAITGRAVKADVAMTGEITLGGRVLPIGGLKEKALAGFHEGIKTILFPEGNIKDLPEIPEKVQKSVKLTPVRNIEDVFKLALSPVVVKPQAHLRKPAVFSSSN